MSSFRYGAFFAYPSRPENIGHSVKDALRTINAQYPILGMKSWEDLQISGRFIIDAIIEEIEDCSIFCADLTGLNPNVLFELGYAVGKNKKIWLCMNSSDSLAKEIYAEFDLLGHVGYSPYEDATTLSAAYNKERPHETISKTIFDDRIASGLTYGKKDHVMHVKPVQQNHTSVSVSRLLAKYGRPIIIDDPVESNVQSMSWYGSQIDRSAAIIVHLVSDANGRPFRLHNAKCAFVAGLGKAMGAQVAMLVEGDGIMPMDYRDLAIRYSSSEECDDRVSNWLDNVSFVDTNKTVDQVLEPAEQVISLARLDLGEHVAENEPAELLSNYFVETSSYKDALHARSSVFVGSKGVGKTATLLKIAHDLKEGHKNLICVIKPPAYELQGLLRLLRETSKADSKSFTIDSLWKFLLLTELANVAVADILANQRTGISDDDQLLIDMVNGDYGLLKEDFSIRLERAVDKLNEKTLRSTDKIESHRVGVSVALHNQFINKLKPALANVLPKYNRVAILVDNLDQAWDINSNISELCDFVLGLIQMAPRLASEFQAGRKHEPVALTTTIFLRADIFHRVLERASEPDKIQHTQIRWTSKEQLLSVIEDRYSSSYNGEAGSNVWIKLFCEKIGDVPTRDHIVSNVLPRPRDIVFFIQVAIENARNRKSPLIELEDIEAAEQRYSKFALESMLVENQLGPYNIRAVVEEFLAEKPIINRAELEDLLRKAKVPTTDVDACIAELLDLSFLGIDVGEGRFSFLQGSEERKRLEILGLKAANRVEKDVKYKVNNALWKYLEIRSDVDSVTTSSYHDREQVEMSPMQPAVSPDPEDEGIARSINNMRQLALQNPQGFDTWCLTMLAASPLPRNKGAVNLFDGVIYLQDGTNKREILVTLKLARPNKITIPQLIAAADKQNASGIVVLLTDEPDYELSQIAKSAGAFRSVILGEVDRVQIITLRRLLDTRLAT